MLTRILMAACLLAALAGCEAPQEPPPAVAAPDDAPASAGDRHAISAAPEHFDRVRAEEFEKEEESLRRRGRRN
jgi:hypothetical protein